MWRDRIVDDGTDREQWLAAREAGIGASDAAKLARPSSVASVLRSKLTPATFTGNEYTRGGHDWEGDILAFLDVAPSTALIHAPGEAGFMATPDGIQDAPGGVVMAECKVKYNRIVAGPTAAEFRQLAWQLMCVPEAAETRFGWLMVVRDAAGDWVPRVDGYQSIIFPRDHPEIVRRAAEVLPLANDLLAALRYAREAEKEVPF